MKILEKFDFSNKKNILLAILIIGVLGITVAFAALTSRLSISGTANVAATRWNIHFQNWSKVSIPTVTYDSNTHQNTATAPEVSALDMTDQTNVTKVSGVDVTLNQPGDTAKYLFEIINEGTIDAKLDNFTATNTTNNELVDYDVKCYESSTREGTQVTEDSVLEANGDIAYCYLQVTYKDQTNSHTAGTNQVYNQSAVSTSLSASWTWIQDNSSISGSIDQQNTPHFIGNTGWKILNPGVTLENQNFEYWDTQSTKIMSGWHDIPDLYGVTQTYYFVNGIAQKGWVTSNNNRYYLSTFDEDENGYVNCNMLKSTKKMIDDTCYSFDASGVATESTGCTGQDQASESNKYYYLDNNSHTAEANSLGSWHTYVIENTSNNSKQVCQQATGTTICIDPSQWSCDANDCSNKNSYTQQKLQEIESHFGTTCQADSWEKRYQCTKYIGNDFVRFEISFDGTSITAGYNYNESDVYETCSIYDGEATCGSM